jgi:TonB family protein
MKFCLEDGAVLVEGREPTSRGSAEATLHMPGPTRQSPGASPTSPPSTITSIGFQPSAGGGGSNSVAESTGSRKGALLWIVIALIIGGSGIAIALIMTRGRDGSSSGIPNANQISSPTPGQNTTESSSSNTESSASPKPADTSQTNRQTEKAAAETASVKPPKSEVKEATPLPPKATPRGPVSGGVLNGKAVRLVQPTYPAIARSAHASGQVRVQVLIDENGNVISAHATSGHPLLQASAVAAARGSKFTPTTLGGEPVKVNGVIIYNFVAAQ